MKSTGILIAIDMYNCKEESIYNREGLRDSVKSFAESCSLVPHTIYLDEEENQEEYAVLLSCKQGHVTLHVRPDKGFAAVDVFTCNKPANPDKMAKEICDYLDPGKLKVTYLERGDYGKVTDMKPRRRTRIKTIKRMHDMGRKFSKMMMKPRSM